MSPQNRTQVQIKCLEINMNNIGDVVHFVQNRGGGDSMKSQRMENLLLRFGIAVRNGLNLALFFFLSDSVKQISFPQMNVTRAARLLFPESINHGLDLSCCSPLYRCRRRLPRV